MRIEAIALEIPSRVLSNDAILDYLDAENPQLSEGDRTRLRRATSRLFHECGAERRYLRDRSRGERAFDLTLRALTRALDDAGMKGSEVDMLIHCGVGRGFVEPADAYFYASALGMECQCFAVSDACMGWLRAAQIASNYMAVGAIRTAVILNSEFTAYENGFPALFRMLDVASLEYNFPAFTIGEAACATVLRSSEAKWTFDAWSRPALAGRCTIPMPGYQDFSRPEPGIGLNGAGRFVCFGAELHAVAADEMLRAIPERLGPVGGYDIWIPHASTSKPYPSLASSVGISPERVYTGVFPAIGNVISASLPAGLSMAREASRLGRGDRVVLCPASAGMSFALATFEY